jgi:predicted Zn finger-like uncharacterized protein
MILTCPECATRYVVNPVNLRPNGRRVRCAKCSHTWFEDAPPPDPNEVPEPAPKPAPPPPSHAAEPTGGEAVEAPRPRDRVVRSGSRTAPRANLPALPRQREHGPVLGWIGLVLFVTIVVGGVLAFPKPLIAAWPDMIKLYAALGMDPYASPRSRTPIRAPAMPPLEERLVFRNLEPAQMFVDGVLTLNIKGQVHNIGAATEDLPIIRVTLLDGRGQDIKTWKVTADELRLSSGASTTFATQIPNPPPEAQDIRVTFDLPAGNR